MNFAIVGNFQRVGMTNRGVGHGDGRQFGYFDSVLGEDMQYPFQLRPTAERNGHSGILLNA